ncbi:MAG: gamma-glutamyl-gamma-aminobutyrate hydrolase family protein [Alphaproteobacteria bacterium]|jgi:putative glutamine amidotransferase|nr:gamma-glutamyl-gamma-aminobutyrate hydrolase family protein [Alphaproteobacteria bacterium]MDP6566663.1 gamma-glutamyl-gamma-aminobutyrate hydrolase family protein [Alphaproteobacteria bacterium]MDP6813043.1 gamma-glutamyl-gamma-aminobutyrate hydrolase family protein [Alphaproteobacteria bacterium]
MQEQIPGIVAIASNFNDDNNHQTHRVSHKYVTAVAESAGAVPVLFPAIGEQGDVETLLANIDGVLLTGGASNIEPHHYDDTPPTHDESLRDPMRDGVVLRLVRQAVDMGVPLFGICRGIQEMNVAFGGSLHQHLHEVPDRFDHRRLREKPAAEQFAPRQRITLTPGGRLQALAEGAETVMVNTLHGQGIDQLGQGLVVEAVADDGTIEAVHVAGASTFAMGVQWHAEWRVPEHDLYAALFAAFGRAVGARAAARNGRGGMDRVA